MTDFTEGCTQDGEGARTRRNTLHTISRKELVRTKEVGTAEQLIYGLGCRGRYPDPGEDHVITGPADGVIVLSAASSRGSRGGNLD